MTFCVMGNKGEKAFDLSDWKLYDENQHEYIFPEGFILPAGGNVTVHTGIGNNSEADLYWGSRRAFWDNDGDTATLEDSKGRVIDHWCSR